MFSGVPCFSSRLKVTTKRGPIDFQIGTDLTLAVEPQASGSFGGCYRSAFPGNFCRDPLCQLADRAIVNQKVGFRLPQHVNEARRDDQAFRINHALRVRAIKFPDGSNAVAENRYVAGNPRIAQNHR